MIGQQASLLLFIFLLLAIHTWLAGFPSACASACEAEVTSDPENPTATSPSEMVMEQCLGHIPKTLSTWTKIRR